ncbi:hypothetical protein BU26DRAFT_584786 [Trematosphaeria pertusa]|uniref:Uncharacterized protein n=1 Tax=Trematosphaeria pertusa TaxID=390896 RepID=A0A6A6HWS6_9PLEO|nr:uncharacterized protein BU26DRAFT_584786 [Trematosphaeria pertusa]KAF2242487.1 hypothetical protein BU26DRAFT_584786 [Trematosphaeria pertusa]
MCDHVLVLVADMSIYRPSIRPADMSRRQHGFLNLCERLEVRRGVVPCRVRGEVFLVFCCSVPTPRTSSRIRLHSFLLTPLAHASGCLGLISMFLGKGADTIAEIVIEYAWYTSSCGAKLLRARVPRCRTRQDSKRHCHVRAVVTFGWWLKGTWQEGRLVKGKDVTKEEDLYDGAVRFLLLKTIHRTKKTTEKDNEKQTIYGGKLLRHQNHRKHYLHPEHPLHRQAQVTAPSNPKVPGDLWLSRSTLAVSANFSSSPFSLAGPPGCRGDPREPDQTESTSPK